MSSDIELGQLRAENAQLKTTVESLRKESAKYRTDRNGKLKEAVTGRAELQAEHEKLKKEHAKALKTIDELPKATAEENARLKGEIRTGKYRTEFDRLAKEAKADPRALDALWKLSDVKADSDEIDVESLKLSINTALDANPYMRESGQVQPQRVITPGPGGGQGGKPGNIGVNFKCTEQQYRDPVFVKANYKEITAAAMANALEVVPSF